jgi:hypothetical protein
LLEHWSHEISDQQWEDLLEPYPDKLCDPDYVEKKPSKSSGTKGKAKPTPRPLYWLHKSQEPLPDDLPGQEKSVDDLSEELPCPNDF